VGAIDKQFQRGLITEDERYEQVVELWQRTTKDVSDSMMTGHPGVFAGGDAVPSERTVTAAVGHGRKAARTTAPSTSKSAWLRSTRTQSAAAAFCQCCRVNSGFVEAKKTTWPG